MSWIKMRASLLTNPKVIAVARLLLADPAFLAWSGFALRDVTENVTHVTGNVTRTERDVLSLLPVVTRITVGALLPLWSTVNECATEEGVLRSTDAVSLDLICGVPGMGEALMHIGWVELLSNENEVSFSNFHEHNTVGRTRSTGAKTGAQRSREYRDRKKQGGDVTRDVTETSQRNHREEKSREDKQPPLPPEAGGEGGASASTTKVGEVCKAIRAAGIPNVNPSNPELRALIDKGVTLETFVAAAQAAAKVTPPAGMAYVLRVVTNQMARAAQIAAGVGVAVVAWDARRDTIEAKARALGMEPWAEHQVVGRESFANYTERVRRAMGEAVAA